MTPLKLANYIRFKLSADSTTLPDSDLLPITNLWRRTFAQRIAEVDEDLFGVPATTDLVAGQREYSLPQDLIKMVYLEAKLDGTNWLKLNELDLNQYGRTTDEDTILKEFANEQGMAYFDVFREAVTLYSGEIIDVTDGLKLFYISYPKDLPNLTDDTTDMSVAPDSTHSGFPEEFQELLARRIIIDIKGKGDKPKALTEHEQIFNDDFEKKLDEIHGKNQGRVVIASLPEDDNGFNY